MRRAFSGLFAALALFATLPARAEAVLPGGNSKEPYTIDAAKLDYFEKEQKLIYTGDVIATQGQTKVKGSVMTIYLDKGGADRQVRRIEILGPVTMVQNGKIGTGDTGLFDKTENKWFLIGNVTLTEGDDVTQGQKLVYDLGKQTALVDSGPQGGRVKSVFTPKNDEKPAEAKAAGAKTGEAKAADAKPGDKPKDAKRKDAKPKEPAKDPAKDGAKDAAAKTAAKRPDEPVAARP